MWFRDLLETSRDIPQGSQHPMIPPGVCWRHLETCWSHRKTYVDVRYIQWYLLDSAGDTWRPAGDVHRHTMRFATSNDISWFVLETLAGACARQISVFATSNNTSWSPLETPGDSLEPSQDICPCLLHPMIPAGFCWRHLETCWRGPETYHEVHYIQWYLLHCIGDTWRLTGACTRQMPTFATCNDASWIPLETPGDLLETSRDIPQGSLHSMISPGFRWRHLETRWSLRKTYVDVCNIQWSLLDSAGDLLETSRAIPWGLLHPMTSPGFCWRCWLEPAQDKCQHSLHSMIPPGVCWRHLETCWSLCKTYVDVHYIQWYLLDSAGDTWRPAGDFQRHTMRFATSNDTSCIPLETPGDLLEMFRDIPGVSRHPMIH